MAAAARRLGISGEFFSTPTTIMGTFVDGDDARTIVRRVPGWEVDLTKLIQLDELAGELGTNHDPKVGLERIANIVNAPVRYRRAMTIGSFGLVSGAAARFFGGGLPEIGVAATIGFTIGGMSLVLGKLPSGARAFELLAAFYATLIASVFSHYVTPVASFVATLAGLIILIPGLTLTTAVAEIATRNLVAGAARLTAAAVVFLQLIFGVALGSRVEVLLWGSPTATALVALPPWTYVVALVACCAGLVIQFRAPPKTAPLIFTASALALWGAKIGGDGLGADVGIFVGAYLVCVAGNLYARFARRPAVVLIVPGLLLLVPGSIGFRSLSELLANDPVAGLNSAFHTGLAAVSIVAGLFMANITVPPRRIL